MPDLHSKSQRLASAVYLITSFFSDQEPLKWRLRGLSADLVSENIKDKFSVCREIGAMFSLAKNSGLVSEPNYEIISQEVSKLTAELEKPLKFAPISEPAPKAVSLPQPAFDGGIKDNSIADRSQDRQGLREFGAVSVKKNSRQSVIIALLKRKREIMIKDVSPLISGCSEKTIQRELLSMVSAGILKKTGEKRWSRYSLA